MSVGGGSYLIWNGEQIEADIRQNSVEAVNDCLREAAEIAARLTYEYFERQTGAAGESWDYKAATESGDMIEGEVGSYGVFYVIFLNEGTVYMDGGHMLQQAASQVFPSLGGRLVSRVG